MDCLPKQVAPGDHYGGEASTSGREKRPTGRVVGIIRRSWRARGYAGSLQPDPPGARAHRALPGPFCSLPTCMHVSRALCGIHIYSGAPPAGSLRQLCRCIAPGSS